MGEIIFPPSCALSNFWNVPGGFIWNEMLWPTSEHAYQAAKYMYEDCPIGNKQYIEIIQSQPSPSKAKCLASQKTMKYLANLQPLIDQWKPFVQPNPHWDSCKVNVMRSVLRSKFDSSQHFRDVLFSTGSMIIKEKSEYDYYWGIGSNGTGSNMLGLLLMELRDSQNSLN